MTGFQARYIGPFSRSRTRTASTLRSQWPSRILIRLRLKEVNAERVAFEAKYGMTFEQFNARFQAEEIADQYSYAVESDYFDWEAAVTNQAYLEELGDTLL